jgi:anti-sigma B factor antagonist
MRLQIETRQVGRVTVVKCAGRIVAGVESDSLLEHVQRLIPSERYIVLHLGEVQFVDSTGLGMLVRLLTFARRSRGDLKLSNVTGTIAHTLKITNLCSILATHDSDAEAIAAFYKPTATKEALRSGTPVLCVDRSCSVLAYLRELLRQEGFDPLTATSISDAQILMKATRPAAVIIGPEFGSMGDAGERFRRAVGSVPLVELGQGFATFEAGEGAQHLLEQVRARVAKAN